MKRRTDLRRALSLLLALLICASAASPVLAEEQGDTIYIESAEDLMELAENCRLDTWSVGKTVVLRGDISLEDEDFAPIPTFGGTFDGQGHTISGMEIDGLETPAGFISVLQETGLVKNLSITGNVAPGGDARTVGGVVGENYGRVENCSFTGTVSGKSSVGSIAGVNAAGGVVSGCRGGGAVFGEKMTGGIVGCSLGTISGCTNNTYVNINSVDPTISLDDINFDFVYDITKLSSSDTGASASDTGGIAGYSSGIIRACVNNSVVGYQHVGYNVGGIAGRSCGYIRDCVNHAEVYGRKDVGGIVGQMEPYLELDLSEDTRDKLQGQLDELSSMIDSTLTRVSDGSGTITRRLNNMSRYLDDAGKALNDLGATGNIDSTVIGGGQAGGSGGVTVTPPDVDAGSSAEAGVGASVVVTPPVSGGAVGGGVETEAAVDWTPGSVDAGGEISGLGELDASTQITVTASAGKLSSAVSGLSGQMHLLNNEVAGLSGGVASDLKAINKQIQTIYETLFDAAEELQSGQSGEYFSDTSEVDVDQVTFGKTASCANDGVISGDINVGGIAGSMAIEYELDPEDDISGSITGVQRRSYEMKAIIQNCTSDALVTAKRSHAGGVCGLMDLGLITGCRGYGNAESENGDYVGGIAGLAAGTVRGCCAKAFLSGEKYVGGIVGSGVAEDTGGSSSLVAGCYAFVSIPDYEQYVGGISGGEAGEFFENYFVSDTLAGINGRSYTGKAEPISYERLISTEGVPKEFQKLTVRFEADGKTLNTVTLDYGETFDPADYPAIPQKEGCYAQWDVPDLGEVRFDQVVTAVYTRYAATLASESRRENRRPVFLVEGLFDQDDMLTATPEAKTAEQLSLLSEDAGEAVGQYFSFLEKKELPASFMCREIVEQWSIQIPDDGQFSHTVRYLPVNGETRNLLVFVKDGDRWKEVDTETVGSCLTFTVRDSHVELAIVSAIPMWWAWLACGLLILVLLLVILRLVRLARRRRRGKPAAAAAAAIPAAVSADDGGEQGELLQRAVDAEREPARTRAELDALRSAKQAGAQTVVKDENLFRQHAGETNIRPEKRRGRKWPLVALLCLLAAAAVLAAVLLLGGKARDGLASYRLLQRCAQRDALSMELTVHAALGDTVLDNTVGIERVSEDGYSVSCIEQYGLPLYYAGDTVYLENGKAYRVGGSYPDSSGLLDQTLELYRDLSISAGDDGYRITAQGSDAEKLVQTLAPSLAELASEIDVVEVELIEEKGSLSAIRFASDGTLSAGDPYTLEAELTILHTKSTAVIPYKVMAAIKDGGGSATMVLTEDVVRLLSAWMDVMQADTMCADLTLEANCGPLVVNDKVQLLRGTESGRTINCIRRSDLALYFTEDTICDSSGNSVSAKEENLVSTTDLLEIAYQACLNGEVSCTERDGGYRYTLELDEKGMEDMAYAISPKTESMDLSYEKSGLEVVLGEDGAISSFRLICSGGVTVVLAETPMSFSAAAVFRDMPEDFEIPAAVSRSLAN